MFPQESYQEIPRFTTEATDHKTRSFHYTKSELRKKKSYPDIWLAVTY